MPATYEPIATTTLANSTTTRVSFSSIPQTYTDLVLVIQGTNTLALHGVSTTYNGVESGPNYSATFLIGDGSSASAARNVDKPNNFLSALGTTQSNSILQIMNYTNTTTYKNTLCRVNAAGSTVRLVAGTFRQTAAITSIDCDMGAGFYGSGTTLTLYGIKAA